MGESGEKAGIRPVTEAEVDGIPRSTGREECPRPNAADDCSLEIEKWREFMRWWLVRR